MDGMISTIEYPYKGVALTPAIIEYLALELFHGRLMERQAIQDEILREHLARGGNNAKTETVTGSVKRALGNMKEKGLVENPALGYWRFAGNSSASEQLPEILTPQSPIQAPVAVTETPVVPEILADCVLGIGSAAVYLYYLPVYRLRAEEQHENVWPCKIGRTDRDPLVRVLSQAGTALPERPYIALVIRTQFALAWEGALHNVLTLRGRRIDDSPGSEWFLTSPDEVVALAKFLDPTLANHGQPQAESKP